MKWFSFAVALAILHCTQSPARDWTDNTGKFHFEGDFDRVADSRVFFKKPDGRSSSIPLDRLCQSDQVYVNSQTATSSVQHTGTISSDTKRTWTDASGTYHVEARLLGRVGDTVWLEKDGGHASTIDINKLSIADRDYVTKRLSSDPVTADPPAVSPNKLNVQDKLAGTGRKIFHFAAAEATAEPKAGAEEIDEYGRRLKYIYCCCCCGCCDINAHIIVGVGPPLGIGTVTYWLWGFHFMDGLEYVPGPFFPFWFYRVTIPGNGYSWWAFSRVPNGCGCYSVWAWNGQWEFKCWACRERVW